MLSLTIVVLLTSDLSILDVKDDAMVCLCTALSFTPSYGTPLYFTGLAVARAFRPARLFRLFHLSTRRCLEVDALGLPFILPPGCRGEVHTPRAIVTSVRQAGPALEDAGNARSSIQPVGRYRCRVFTAA